uniref:Uncharacterized protein n=1 Tax=Aegilops tauschii subsp. strangulata TaxID=200361 RepID=A0A453ND35_AEGTS
HHHTQPSTSSSSTSQPRPRSHPELQGPALHHETSSLCRRRRPPCSRSPQCPRRARFSCGPPRASGRGENQ